MAYIEGAFRVNGLPRNGATVNLYDVSSFPTPPKSGDALPTSGILATQLTSPDNGSDGGYRFTVGASGQWWVGVQWNGSTAFDYFDLPSFPNVAFPTIKDTGATGDGTHDDTTLLQSAIDANVGGQLYVPAGTYMCGTLNIKCSLFGPGAFKKINPDANTGNFCQIPSSASGIALRGVGFDGAVTVSGSGYDGYIGAKGLQVYADDVILEGVRVQNCFTAGIYASAVNRLVIDHCHVKACRGQFGDGIYLPNSHDCIVNDNHIEDYTRIGIVNERASGVHSGRNLITRNSIYNGHDASILTGGTEYNAGIWCENTDSALVSDNCLRSITHYGVVVVPNATVTVPSQPTAAAATSGGTIPAGTWYVKVTCANANGETQASAESSVITTTGSTSKITVTGPTVNSSLDNVSSVNVYMTPASASPGTEVLVGSYTTGSTYVITAVPAGTNAAAPTVNTTDSTCQFTLEGNDIQGPVQYGYKFAGATASGRVNIEGGQVIGMSNGGITIGNVGGDFEIRGVHFGTVANMPSSNGLIVLDQTNATYALQNLAIIGCSKEANSYAATTAADLNIFNTNSGAGLINLYLADLVGDWYTAMRQECSSIRAANCRLIPASTTYSLLNSTDITCYGCKITSGAVSGVVNTYTGGSAATMRMLECDLTNLVMSAPTNPTASGSVFLFSNCTFDNFQWQPEVGLTRFAGCYVADCPTNGFAYGAFHANVWSLEAVGCRVTGTSGNPFVKFRSHGPTRLVLLDNDVDVGIATVSGMQPTVFDAPNAVTVTSGSAYTALQTDKVIVTNRPSTGTAAITLMASPETGRRVTIKDGSGNAATFNITISPAAGNIDGAGTKVISTNYGSVALIYDGSQWRVI